MKTSLLMYGEPAEVSNELCSCNDPEAVLHVDLIAALGNALCRIDKLEKALWAKPEIIQGPINSTPMPDWHKRTCSTCDKLTSCETNQRLSVCETDPACDEYVHGFRSEDAI